MWLLEASRRELAVLFRELSRLLRGELGGAPGPPKERKEERCPLGDASLPRQDLNGNRENW